MATKTETVKEEIKLTDTQMDKEAQTFGQQLKKMPKVKVVIPVDSLNKNSGDVTVCLNGYVYQIQRGKAVNVPEPIAEILEESGYLSGTR